MNIKIIPVVTHIIFKEGNLISLKDGRIVFCTGTADPLSHRFSAIQICDSEGQHAFSSSATSFYKEGSTLFTGQIILQNEKL